MKTNLRYAVSETVPGPVVPNIAQLLVRNGLKFGGNTAFGEEKDGSFQTITWTSLVDGVQRVASGLRNAGFGKGDKMVIFSPNRLEMLKLELAVMASGGISVPIFAFFIRETAELLIRHSEAAWVAVAGDLQLGKLSADLPLKKIIHFDAVTCQTPFPLISFSNLHADSSAGDAFLPEADPSEICLNMYTSGTMGTPKCVELSHRNILSQQAALDCLWNINRNDRFLSYLPWHHSFGGIFELFTALYHGAAYYIEPGFGKDTSLILKNWKMVKPTVFFSVPKVYQSLFDLVNRYPETETDFFHSGIRFFFTAAAPLPERLSKEFADRNIIVIEGWGLTETSPCCTLTVPGKPRVPGLVGEPLPGVELRLGEEDEIQVRGPNVMRGYFKNPEANKQAFTSDGWFRTGDVGKITGDGLVLVSRRDRIFKLSNGEKVIPTDLEKLIEKKCHMISFALVTGGGRDYPVALLFPNMRQFEHNDYSQNMLDGCFCPRNLEELGRCLRGCLHDANCGIKQKFSKVQSAMIISDELSVDKNTLTPSLKLAPNKVLDIYKAHLENLYGGKNDLKEEVYVIRLNETETSDKNA